MRGRGFLEVSRLAALAMMLSAAGPPDDAMRIPGGELPDLLVGRTLETPPTLPIIIYDQNRFERFAADGSWSHFGGRARGGGGYRFVGDQVCVTFGEITRCRWLLRDGRGQLFAETLVDGRLVREPVYLSNGDR